MNVMWQEEDFFMGHIRCIGYGTNDEIIERKEENKDDQHKYNNSDG